MFQWPLMRSNFEAEDFFAIADLLSNDPDEHGRSEWNLDVRLTQGEQVRAFEREFSEWQGCRHSIFVNSGASANLLTMAALRERWANSSARMWNKVLVPCITWASDVTSVLHSGFEPVFVDIDRRTLGMDRVRVGEAIERHKPVAVFLTHCMGYNALDDGLKGIIGNPGVVLLEDCCESIGAEHYTGFKVGNAGLASNFSFYYAHHMTTVEGGMVCTDDSEFADVVRRLRGHGLAREGDGWNVDRCQEEHADLDPQFVFTHAGYNCRNTEIGAVLGRSQLKRLDGAIEQRRENLKLFLSRLDPSKYQTDFAVEGSSPYALTLVLKESDCGLRDRVGDLLRRQGVECRRGIAGGGNQLRQPYLRRRYGTMYAEFPNAEHVHWNGWCIGNYPGLEREKIERLTEGLNKL